MIHTALFDPKSIVVVGGSDNTKSPGGSALQNLISNKYKGSLYVVNPKQKSVQGMTCYASCNDLPNVNLAIIAISASHTSPIVKILTEQKNTKAFIIYSAGFSEKNEEGKQLEEQIVSLINKAGGSLLGPNNIGLINQNYAGIFTKPIPKLNSTGIDLISGSGATAVFILEAAIKMGLPFSSIISVGNSAQIGVEEILEYLDFTFNLEKSSPVKILYIESIKRPDKFLKHTLSLIKKGCKIAAIKAGSSTEGSRAASSHTGALTTSDIAIEALFKKAGIIRCFSRLELITVAGIFMHKPLKGNRIAIITHAGGPAVMLTDCLSKNYMKIPQITGKESNQLLEKLYSGSSVSNPIDFLATGTAKQLDTIITYCNTKFKNIDAMVVIFGSPGLTTANEAYEVIDKHMKSDSKPIYPILPSVINVKQDIESFISKGHILFTDEVVFGNSLAKIYNNTLNIVEQNGSLPQLDNKAIKNNIPISFNGYLPEKKATNILKTIGINTVNEFVLKSEEDICKNAQIISYPAVLKVVGPIHKTDIGGVLLNIKDISGLKKGFHDLMKIENAKGILIQPMLNGLELFIGIKREVNFGAMIMFGIGGIFIEIVKDFQFALAPISSNEALKLIKKLKAYPILKGYRGANGINIEKFANYICLISLLAYQFPEIEELDLNPLIANDKSITCVDARIKINS